MSEILKYSGWRPIRDHKVPFDPSKGEQPGDSPLIPTTRFFDQLSFIGNEWVGCFILETSEGLVMIDCMEPEDKYVDMIEQGIKDLGLNACDLKAILITHGHGDHYGKADYFREKYGAKLYMSKVDEDFARDPASPRPKHRVPLSFQMDGYLTDGDVFTCGEIKIAVVSTPGHTPGCLSYIIPVTDEGRPHNVALWGGTGIPRDQEDKEQYIQSSDYFTKVCDEMGVDAEIATHPFIDNTRERLAVCRNIVNGSPNPYVIGKEAAARYQKMFKDMCLAQMK